MKRWLFIIGIVIITLLTAVWVALMFLGPSGTDGVFNLFNFSDTTDPNAPLDEVPAQPVVDITDPEAMRQLTTKPVIGHTEVKEDASSTPRVIYAEAGTGHLFSIDIISGEEDRISNITVPLAKEALISEDGTLAVIGSGEGQSSTLTLITIGENGSTSATTLPEGGENLWLTRSNELLYTTKTQTGALAKVYNPDSNTSRTLFEVPFREVHVEWGSEAAATHTFYPKAASRLTGALYSASKGMINRLPISGYGLTAHITGTHILYATQANNAYTLSVFDISSKSSYQSPLPVLPEKCATARSGSMVICPHSPETTYDIALPDVWYQGALSFTDDLIKIDFTTGEISTLVNTLALIGREIDMINLSFSGDDARIYLTNKNDRSLWMIDTTITN